MKKILQDEPFVYNEGILHHEEEMCIRDRPELGKRVGVNKSTIQRYEADGVDPKRTTVSYTHLKR